MAKTVVKLPQMDDSQIYDLEDEPGRAARYALILPNNRAVFAESEAIIALVQRAWRALHGFDPMTGESGFDGDCVLRSAKRREAVTKS